MSANPDTTVKLLPNISGFVGDDIAAGILYSKTTENRQLSLLVDIGTNNEMALGNDDFLLCCSAAAGPALEGAKISSGMRAASGAIEKVKIEGKDNTSRKQRWTGSMPLASLRGTLGESLHYTDDGSSHKTRVTYLFSGYLCPEFILL